MDMLTLRLYQIRWVRRLLGGHWERYSVVPTGRLYWFRVPRCALTYNGAVPMGICRGMPDCEDW